MSLPCSGFIKHNGLDIDSTTFLGSGSWIIRQSFSLLSFFVFTLLQSFARYSWIGIFFLSFYEFHKFIFHLHHIELLLLLLTLTCNPPLDGLSFGVGTDYNYSLALQLGPEAGSTDGRTKKISSFLFHPFFPLALSIQHSLSPQPSVVNIHFRRWSSYTSSLAACSYL